MTKKHFIRLADYIRMANNGETDEKFNWKQIAILASFCKEQNPNFKRDVFENYINGLCGPSGGKLKK